MSHSQPEQQEGGSIENLEINNQLSTYQQLKHDQDNIRRELHNIEQSEENLA